jgi:hypothetical protein
LGAPCLKSLGGKKVDFFFVCVLGRCGSDVDYFMSCPLPCYFGWGFRFAIVMADLAMDH